MRITLHQLDRPLKETMYISRGGFNHRTHNLLSLDYNGRDFVAEIIGDSPLIRHLVDSLFSFLANRHVVSIGEFYELSLKWEKSFVYLESCSSVNSIVCACSLLYVLHTSRLNNISIFEVLRLDQVKRNHTEVYASNIYWKESPDLFKQQISEFDFNNTNILKAHLGRGAPSEEVDYYSVLAEDPRIERCMIDFNCGYCSKQYSELNDALLAAPKLTDKLIWIEEPGLPIDTEKWRTEIKYSLAAGENHHSLDQLCRLVDAGVEWVMPDLGRTLRMLEFPKLLKKCIDNSAGISFHSYSSGYLAYISLYMSFALDENKTLYEHDFSTNALIDCIPHGAISFRCGSAFIPEFDLDIMTLRPFDNSWTWNQRSVRI